MDNLQATNFGQMGQIGNVGAGAGNIRQQFVQVVKLMMQVVNKLMGDIGGTQGMQGGIGGPAMSGATMPGGIGGPATGNTGIGTPINNNGWNNFNNANAMPQTSGFGMAQNAQGPQAVAMMAILLLGQGLNQNQGANAGNDLNSLIQNLQKGLQGLQNQQPGIGGPAPSSTSPSSGNSSPSSSSTGSPSKGSNSLKDLMSRIDKNSSGSPSSSSSSSPSKGSSKGSSSKKDSGKSSKTKRKDPIVLDLNGDGKAGVSDGPTTNFDFDTADGTGKQEKTQWLKKNSGDGMLVWDVDNDGQITSSKELFGNFDINGQENFTDGYQKLAKYFDKNKDGKVEAGEMQGLKIWKDDNADGKTQPGELKSLQEMGVSSFDVSKAGQGAGVEGSFTKDGQQQKMWDVNFQYQQ